MAGETALATLLRSMSPHSMTVIRVLHRPMPSPGCEIIGSFREQEGLT